MRYRFTTIFSQFSHIPPLPLIKIFDKADLISGFWQSKCWASEFLLEILAESTVTPRVKVHIHIHLISETSTYRQSIFVATRLP